MTILGRAATWIVVALPLGSAWARPTVAMGAIAAPVVAAPVVAAPVASTATTPAPHAARRRDGLDAASAPGACRKFPAGKRIVKLNLKPDTELADLIAWISSITCKQFILPGTINSSSKKVTIFAPQPLTPEEAYRLFLDALDSVGLTVQPTGRFLQIIETAKAKSGPIPFYGADGRLWSAQPKTPR
jgi:general secretion pathway protein D